MTSKARHPLYGRFVYIVVWIVLTAGLGLANQRITAPQMDQKAQPGTSQPSPGSPVPQRQEQQPQRDWWWTYGPAIASAGAAIVSALLAVAILIVYFGQWRAMRQQVGYMRDALYLIEGADVQLEETVFTAWPLRENLSLTVLNVKWRNFGRSSAKEVVFDLALGVPGQGPVKEPFPANPPVVIAPNQTYPYGFQPLADILPPEHIDGVFSGRLPLRLWGTVQYIDVFTRRHELRIGASWIVGTNALRWDEYAHTITAASSRVPNEGRIV